MDLNTNRQPRPMSSAEERLARAYGSAVPSVSRRDEDVDKKEVVKVDDDAEGDGDEVEEEESSRKVLEEALKTQDEFLEYVKSMQVRDA